MEGSRGKSSHEIRAPTPDEVVPQPLPCTDFLRLKSPPAVSERQKGAILMANLLRRRVRKMPPVHSPCCVPDRCHANHPDRGLAAASNAGATEELA